MVPLVLTHSHVVSPFEQSKRGASSTSPLGGSRKGCCLSTMACNLGMMPASAACSCQGRSSRHAPRKRHISPKTSHTSVDFYGSLGGPAFVFRKCGQIEAIEPGSQAATGLLILTCPGQFGFLPSCRGRESLQRLERASRPLVKLTRPQKKTPRSARFDSLRQRSFLKQQIQKGFGSSWLPFSEKPRG